MNGHVQARHNLRSAIFDVLIKTYTPIRFEIAKNYKDSVQAAMGDYYLKLPSEDRLCSIRVEYADNLGGGVVLALRNANTNDYPFWGISQDSTGAYWVEHWYNPDRILEK